jgi:type VI protein secretion system component Hcp
MAPTQDMFLTFVNEQTLRGDSAVAGFVGAIVVQSFFVGLAGPQGGSTGVENYVATPATPASYSELTLLKLPDTASRVLLSKCTAGQQVGDAMLVVAERGADNVWRPQVTYTLTKVIVTRVEWDGRVDEGKPVETVALRFDTLHILYQGPGANQTVA